MDDTTLQPAAPQPPSPPSGALDKFPSGADPANSMMAEAQRLGGILGGVAIGAATGAAHHAESDSSVKLDMSTSRPLPVKLDMSTSRPLTTTNLQGGGKNGPTAGIDVPATDENEFTDPATGLSLSQMADPRTLKMAGTVAGAEIGGLAAAPVAAAVGGGYLGSAAAGGVAGGVQQAIQTPISQVAEGENPFRMQMLKQTAAQTAEGAGAGAATGAVLHGVGEGIGAIANKYRSIVTPSAAEAAGGLPSEVTEAHFTPIADSEIPKLAGGKTPFVGDQPFDRSTISAMPQAKALNTDAINLLQNYAGDTIPAGSHEMNTAMRAITPLTENINRLGLEMNQAIQSAPEFAQSTIEDDIGTKLLDDIQTMKENLPDGPNSKQAEIITKQMGASHDALTSTDPQEILMARRKLGDQIDKAWKEASTNPDTNKEVQIAARKTIYGALTDKLHQIEGVAKADADFQPHLDLRNWFDKVLPEGVAYDPVLADQLQSSEFQKGLKINAIKAHNDRVANNRSIASHALGYTIGGGLLADVAKHTLLPSKP